MISNKMQSARGISLVSLSITIIVMIILANVVIYNVRDNLRLEKLENMQNDIENLRDKISSYYAQNGKIPANLEYGNITHINDAGVISNKVDTGKFFVIDLSALDNLTLNYGRDYENVKKLENLTEENYKDYTDLYIINETSHNIFYVAGITIDDETYYTDYTSDGIDTASVDLRYEDDIADWSPEYNEVGIYKDKNGDIAYIPEGFRVSNKIGETLIGEGLVVQAPDESEFVWVPVENMNNFKEIEGYSNGSLQDILTECSEPYTSEDSTEKEKYNVMKQSVEKYHGFYIGRYETGKDDDGQVVVKKDVLAYNNIKWGASMTDTAGGVVELAKGFATENGYTSVKSTLCYGVQWDATMQFFDSNYNKETSNSSSYVVNSDEKGNYSGTLMHTGSNNDYSIKNIYDMAGNLCEWTMEAYSTNSRVIRGGSYKNNGVECPVSNRSEHELSNSLSDIGFRIALYLE